MEAPVVVRIDLVLALYVMLAALCILAWWWYAGSAVEAVFMGLYVGSTGLIAAVTIYVLYVGLGNVDVRWS